MVAEKVPAIYGALLKVMDGVSNIPKNGYLAIGGGGYNYLRADDVQDKLNPLLIANKVIVKSDYTVDNIERGNRAVTNVNLTLTYIAIEDGSQLEVTAVGEALAGDDKSINKALTQAIKNCHRTTFQFSSGEPDPDADAPVATPKPSAAQAKVNAAKAPVAARPPVNSPVRDKIKTEFLDTGKATKEQANDLKVKAEADGLKGDAVWDFVYAELQK